MQFVQCLILDLADSFIGTVQLSAHLFQRQNRFSIQTEAQTQHFAFAFTERIQQLQQLFNILYFEQCYDKVRFLEELVTGKARADVVMVLPDKVCGIEIKSDADSYSRLDAQVKYYDKYYDENYLVVGSTHALHAAEHVPAYWGIISPAAQPS